MYDFIRLETKSLSFLHDLLKVPLLKNKVSGYNHDTAEVLGTIKVKYQGLTFELFVTGRIVIFGSLHKYFNNGDHNYNDFGYNQLIGVISDLKDKFGPEILNMAVTGLEFGVNINTPFTPQRFTERCISHFNKERTPIIRDDLKGYDKGISFNSTDYRIKIYNKSKQYKQPVNILRLEVKYLRSRIFESADIKTFKDVLNSHSIDALANDLFKRVGEVVYNEDLNRSKLTRNEERIYLECINSQYWKQWTKEKRSKKKIQFTQLIKKYSKSHDKTLVLDLMKRKYLHLMNDNKSGHDFHDYKTGYNSRFPHLSIVGNG